VQVQMSDRLPCLRAVVDDQAVAVGGDPFGARDLAGDDQEPSDPFGVVGLEGVDGGDMLIGDDQDVDGRLWVDVAKSGDRAVGVDDGGGRFAVDDAAKYAGMGHVVASPITRLSR